MGPVTVPDLVTVAHGTRHPTGNDVAREITHRAGRRLGWRARASYVELCEPAFDEVVAAALRPTVAVPLLLTTGFHVREDLPGAVAAAPGRVELTPPLGPHPLLAQATASRLQEAGARPGERVVLVAAGSRDRTAGPGLRRACRLLAAAWGGEVRLATLSGPGPRPEAVVRAGDAVAPYLLAPGHFLERAVAEGVAAGAAVVAHPLGAHPAVVELVARRALAGGVRAGWVRSRPRRAWPPARCDRGTGSPPRAPASPRTVSS